MAEPHRVLIAPERLAGWLTGFDERHGTARTVLTDTHLTLVSPDDAEADIELIWGPLPGHDAQRELLAQLEESFTGESARHSPRSNSWLDSVKDFFGRIGA